MIWESADLDILPGQEAAFETAAARARPIFLCARGCRGMEIHRILELPGRYRLLVQWETLDDHTVHFRQSQDFQEWRALVSSCFASPPQVVHTEPCI